MPSHLHPLGSKALIANPKMFSDGDRSLSHTSATLVPPLKKYAEWSSTFLDEPLAAIANNPKHFEAVILDRETETPNYSETNLPSVAKKVRFPEIAVAARLASVLDPAKH